MEIHNSFDELCYWCIQLMYQMADIFGITYGAVNIWLFVIFEPLAILFFCLSAGLLFPQKRSKTMKKISKGMFIGGIISCLAVVLPIIYTLIYRLCL